MVFGYEDDDWESPDVDDDSYSFEDDFEEAGYREPEPYATPIIQEDPKTTEEWQKYVQTLTEKNKNLKLALRRKNKVIQSDFSF